MSPERWRKIKQDCPSRKTINLHIDNKPVNRSICGAKPHDRWHEKNQCLYKKDCSFLYWMGYTS